MARRRRRASSRPSHPLIPRRPMTSTTTAPRQEDGTVGACDGAARAAVGSGGGDDAGPVVVVHGVAQARSTRSAHEEPARTSIGRARGRSAGSPSTIRVAGCGVAGVRGELTGGHVWLGCAHRTWCTTIRTIRSSRIDSSCGAHCCRPKDHRRASPGRRRRRTALARRVGRSNPGEAGGARGPGRDARELRGLHAPPSRGTRSARSGALRRPGAEHGRHDDILARGHGKLNICVPHPCYLPCAQPRGELFARPALARTHVAQNVRISV